MRGADGSRNKKEEACREGRGKREGNKWKKEYERERRSEDRGEGEVRRAGEEMAVGIIEGCVVRRGERER